MQHLWSVSNSPSTTTLTVSSPTLLTLSEVRSSDRTMSALQVKLVPSAVLNGSRVRLLVNWYSDKDDTMEM